MTTGSSRPPTSTRRILAWGDAELAHGRGMTKDSWPGWLGRRMVGVGVRRCPKTRRGDRSWDGVCGGGYRRMEVSVCQVPSMRMPGRAGALLPRSGTAHRVLAVHHDHRRNRRSSSSSATRSHHAGVQLPVPGCLSNRMRTTYLPAVCTRSRNPSTALAESAQFGAIP